MLTKQNGRGCFGKQAPRGNVLFERFGSLPSRRPRPFAVALWLRVSRTLSRRRHRVIVCSERPPGRVATLRRGASAS